MTMQALKDSSVKKSMLTYLTTFGVDDWLFVLNVCIAVLVCVLLRFYAWAFIAIALHFVLMVVTRLSPQILLVYVRFRLQARLFTPGTSPLQRRGLRPEGFRLEMKV